MRVAQEERLQVHFMAEATALKVEVIEPLSATAQVDDVVLLHGWGTDSRIWQLLIPYLRQHCRIHVLDLPGFGVNARHNLWHDEGQLLQVLAQALPATMHLVGWSLGGNVALAFARQFGSRVKSLTLLACNPSFVARTDHICAMATAEFDHFLATVKRNPGRALSRFEQLQCRDDRCAGELLQQLRGLPASGTDPASWALIDALLYLGQVDQRADLPRVSEQLDPLFILGACDQLVPATLAAELPRALVLPGMAHVPMVADPAGLCELLLAEIRRYDDEQARQRKRRIAHSFSKAASTYDHVAALQREVGQNLFDLSPPEPVDRATGIGVDLGCGTGLLLRQWRQSQPQRCWLGGDIALGMLQHIRVSSAPSAANLLALDAECLPFADASVQLLFSNLAVQWCEDLDALFAEAARVLVPGGQLMFSTLLNGTLAELRTAWSVVDQRTHVNRFYSDRHWACAALKAGLQVQRWQQEQRVTGYHEVAELVYELKALGAHNVDQGRAIGLTGRSRWRALRRAYECERGIDGLLPATWQVLYGVVRKPLAVVQ